MEIMTILTSKSMVCMPHHLHTDCSLNSTKMICSTILILSIIFAVLFFLLQLIRLWNTRRIKKAEMEHELNLKDKQLEAKKYEEKSFYRKKIANLQELMAKEKTVEIDPETKKRTEILETAQCTKSIDAIDNLIKDVDTDVDKSATN